jgi:hypothetical protein
MDFSPDELIDILDANHLHFVEGDFTKELRNICKLLNIETICT